MKLTKATEQDKIKALAELDGWTNIHLEVWDCEIGSELVGITPDSKADAPIRINSYLTSYDAIIPLIQKQHKHVRIALLHHLFGMVTIKHEDYWQSEDIISMQDATPQQLADALLVATGKFEL